MEPETIFDDPMTPDLARRLARDSRRVSTAVDDGRARVARARDRALDALRRPRTARDAAARVGVPAGHLAGVERAGRAGEGGRDGGRGRAHDRDGRPGAADGDRPDATH